MKFGHIEALVFGGLAIFMIGSCTKKQNDDPDTALRTLKKTYMVDGMTCGGCAAGIKIKLKQAGFEKNIQNVSYDNSAAILGFLPTEYTPETDCKVIKAINNEQYTAYLDEANKFPCK